jgi:hypothetical protein
MELPSINETIFNDPQYFLGSFWLVLTLSNRHVFDPFSTRNAILDQNIEVLSKHTVEIGRWVRVNGTLMQQNNEKAERIQICADALLTY